MGARSFAIPMAHPRTPSRRRLRVPVRRLAIGILVGAVAGAVALGGASPATAATTVFLPDPTFDAGAGADGLVRSIVIDAEGRLLVGGDFTSFNGAPAGGIVRLNPDGSTDATFDVGTGIGGFGTGIDSISLAPGGTIVVGGRFTSFNGAAADNVVRLNADGSTDTTFTGGSQGSPVHNTYVYPDGRVLISGFMTFTNGRASNGLLRLNADGSVDPTLDSNFGATNTNLNAMKVDTAGRILAGGLFGVFNGVSSPRVARANADGTPDTTFDVGVGPNASLRSIALEQDGGIIIGGDFTSVAGTPAGHVARLNPDGSLDTTFSAPVGADGSVESITVAPDGRILLAGSFTAFAGTPAPGLVRVNPDGSRDTTFNTDSGTTDGIASMTTIDAAGRILVGGNFTTLAGNDAPRIARLVAETSPTITSAVAPAAFAGRAYTHTVAATGTAPITYSVATGSLPTGLTLNPATGALSGTPTAPGTYAFTIAAANRAGIGTQQNSVTITAPTAPTITGAPQDGTVGAGYDFAFALDGTPDPTAAVTAGALPDGLALAADGTLSGTPTAAGTFHFTVTASNGTAPDATLEVTLTISAATVVTPPAPPSPPGQSDPGSDSGASSLADTGSDILPAMGAGAFLVALGVALALVQHRRRRRA